ncbi:MAG TPA: hypothetical protein VMT30_06740 [Candidatus Saccharimonadia bacterium]|nr:hypothetical protein [Candidatus Saccharimonadia bacterium]
MRRIFRWAPVGAGLLVGGLIGLQHLPAPHPNYERTCGYALHYTTATQVGGRGDASGSGAGVITVTENNKGAASRYDITATPSVRILEVKAGHTDDDTKLVRYFSDFSAGNGAQGVIVPRIQTGAKPGEQAGLENLELYVCADHASVPRLR